MRFNASTNRRSFDDQRIEKIEFLFGDLALLFNSRLSLFPTKLKSKWIGTFLITKVFPYRAVELENKKGAKFTLNEKRIKTYKGHEEIFHKVFQA